MSEPRPLSAPQYRLPSIRAVDVFLAVLQEAFSQENMVDGQNPYRFDRNDPRGSKVWICDPDSRVDGVERDGQRMLITVERGEYVPDELGRHNQAEIDFQGTIVSMDKGRAVVYIKCEAGNKIQSEALANIVYGILKMFRRQIMADMDILNYRMLSISVPVKFGDAPASPWVTTVSLQVEVQEYGELRTRANALNTVNLQRQLEANTSARVGTLD
jgi:hypothetical protein